eukprot:GHVN01073599.1.p1 GENE.GHVN01073599.1~~GHVN01073599.1.p1  ORF type:complete len:499 (-),score=36.13 GHVN01073599.1:1844-3205(-)
MGANSREKTAFATRKGTFQWNVMPFGLVNAPMLFQRMMDEVLRPLRYKGVLVYIDDIIIYSKTIEEHKKILCETAKLINSAGLKLNLEKCEFLKEEVSFLGHSISAAGTRPIEENKKKIQEIERPKSRKDVQAFLGLVNYYREYIPKLAELSTPMIELTKKYVKFKWGDEQEKAFVAVKEMLNSDQLLKTPDYTREFIVQTDASGTGLGAILSQKDEHGREKIVSLASRVLNKHERNYSIPEKECLAIVFALKKFRYIIHGRRFRVVTDHRALQWLDKHKDEKSKLMRWALEMQEMGDFLIEYRAGVDNGNADAFSRLVDTGEANKLEDEEIERAHSKLGHAGAKPVAAYLEGICNEKVSEGRIDGVIKRCDTCQFFTRKYDNFQRTVGTAFRPFQKIAIDTVCMPRHSDSEERHLVVAVDYFSKWVFAKALERKTADEIRDFVRDEICLNSE